MRAEPVQLPHLYQGCGAAEGLGRRHARFACSWRADAPHTLDLAAFEEAARAPVDRAAVARAVAALRGALAPACVDEWLVAERDRLRGLYGHCLLAGIAPGREERLGQIGGEERRLGDALALVILSLESNESLADRRSIALCLGSLAMLAAREGQPAHPCNWSVPPQRRAVQVTLPCHWLDWCAGNLDPIRAQPGSAAAAAEG